jgi:hypothetical protein
LSESAWSSESEEEPELSATWSLRELSSEEDELLPEEPSAEALLLLLRGAFSSLGLD